MMTQMVLLSMIDKLILIQWTVVLAYQYTSLTSVMLLDCWSIPSVMLLTWIFLKTKYRFKKITGVVVCIAGLVLVVFSDVHAGDRAGRWPSMYRILASRSHVYTLTIKCTHKLLHIFILRNNAISNNWSLSFILEIMQSVIIDPYLLLPLVTCIIPHMLVFKYVIFTCHRWKQSS